MMNSKLYFLGRLFQYHGYKPIEFDDNGMLIAISAYPFHNLPKLIEENIDRIYSVNFWINLNDKPVIACFNIDYGLDITRDEIHSFGKDTFLLRFIPYPSERQPL